MKKVLVILALAFAAIQANAQVYAGGALSINGQKGNVVFGIAPEIGYNLTDNIAVGVAAPLVFGDGYSIISVDPYVRYYFLEAGPVRLFADAEFNFSRSKIESYGANTWGVGVKPGLAVPINDSFSIVAHFCRLGYYADAFQFQFNTGSSIGLFYAF